MQYKRLGKTGLQVSPLALGCMTFGVPERGTHPWTLDEEASRPIIRRAVELGINFFDTANMYSDGTSEEIVGRALKDFTRREETVIATKLYYPMGKGPNRGGLSRKAIMTEVDASLRRLGTDYIDLYQIHRWDDDTPLEETLEALHDVVKAGKVRYLGASSMHAWQFARALYLAERHGWTRFVSMQNHLNLLYREEEREMLPLCAAEGIGVIPWSPLARGRLARDWDVASKRSDTDEVTRRLYAATEDADRRVADAVKAVAGARGVPRAQVAMAWVAQKAGVTAPIVGASRLSQLEDAAAALKLRLSAEEIAQLEAPYVPHRVAGFV
ncbi:aldo/keto reductase [Massilia forsythiae]|uniref:Aldo/keto reductase n=1 Tax=Massilia forsythiae TaxID=2728020 RepID=A0A7Z2VZ87_9BURK|nr:aldo/keto reductase [Massilia forsythiae]QJE02146.1 aldo/keto reductase [Massilia forsythiae]